ncbi:MAG: Nif3-like dinuclear metal center hexameric protein [Candidatus Hydrogenedentes bacterium]|nr:Nif3-like dinuclear metal center hexameric protein [Candidatus Hydrogenedentota bacterium]
MTVREVCAILERLAPSQFAYSWDRAGLALGDPSAPVSRVLVALTVTSEVLQAAKRARAQLIVSHHPLIWEPLKSLRSDNPHARLCLDLASAEIACFSAHTNLDLAPGGVNDVLAAKLGLINLRPLLDAEHVSQVKLVTFVPEAHLAAVRDAVCNAGAGVIGDYTYCSFSSPGIGTFLPGDNAQPFTGRKHTVNEEPERRFEVLVHAARLEGVLAALRAAHPYEEVAYDIVPLANRDDSIGLGRRGDLPKAQTLKQFGSHVRKALGLSHIRLVGDPSRRVRQVGVIGGAGGNLLDSIPPTVDVLITGDVDYHAALAATERGLAVIDAGHHGTEIHVVPALAGYLKKCAPKLRVSTYIEAETFRAITE